MLKFRFSTMNTFLQGIFFIALGFLFISRWQALWALVHLILAIGFIYLSIFQIYTLLIKKEKKISFSSGLSILSSVVIAIYAIVRPSKFINFVPYVIGWWALINGIIQALNYYVYRRDCLRGTGWRFFLTWINFLSALGMLFLPVGKLVYLSLVAGIYLIFYGLVTAIESLKDLLSPVTKRKLIRHMNISVPIFISALIPQRVFLSIHSLAKTNKLEEVPLDRSNDVDLEVFFYLAGSGPESLGHVDLSYQGKIYSYGCHDPLNRHLFGTMGDGVLIVSERDAFLRNALQGENKTVIGYGINLNEKQNLIIEERLNELLSRSEEWKCALALDENSEAKDYASRVYRATKAKMLKFKEGKFRTYFVFSTNCVLLADQILRCPQLDLFNLTGIVTPGSYLSFLNDEYCRAGSMVVTRSILRGWNHD